MYRKYKLLSWLLLMTFASTLGFIPDVKVFAEELTAKIYFQDDFQDGNYTDPAWSIVSGTWSVGTDPSSTNNKVMNQTDSSEGIISAGDSTWKDYTVATRFNTKAGAAYPGILARFQDKSNYYYFQIQKTGNLVFSKVVNGTSTTLKSTSYSMKTNTWYTLKVSLVGTSIKCYIVENGVDKLIFDVVDSTYSSGKIGIRNKWEPIYLDDVIVTEHPAVNSSVIQSDSKSSTSVSLKWDVIQGATSYNIYRSTSSGSGYSFVSNITDNSFVDNGLTMDTIYYYKMAYLYGGLTESQWTHELSVKTDLGISSTPTGLTLTPINSSKINISWSAVSKADGYKLYRSSDSGNTFKEIYSGASLTYSDTGLTANTSYSYKVASYNVVGESTQSSAVQANTYAYDAPSNFAAESVTDTSVTLKWDAVEGKNVTYNITKSTSSSGTFNQVYSGIDTKYTDNGLTQGTGYFYKINAVVDDITSAVSDVLGVGTVRTAFTPGAVWADTQGNPIDAHGAGIMYDEITKKYYWYGEEHTTLGWPAGGVSVYSSTDLYNWTNEGMALTLIRSKDDFTKDPLISKLYAGRTDTDNIWADIRLGRIVERPKVIYNDKTKKYVMWAHIDGDKDPNNDAANYGKAQSGCAISDSPTGPFVYQRSYRMDQCPPDQTDYYPSSKGMARDMNLFKDDDGIAYLIYSSEENLTLYISKLTEDYLDVTGWHKDGNVDSNGNPVRDTTYKAVYGEDYTRVYPGAQREAPALFKYDGKYYMITSGATGWAANQNKYTVADNIMGPWQPYVDPFVRTLSTDPDPTKAFGTQTTCVIPVDAKNGKFIYVGDIWISSSLKTSKYVWLPIDFGQKGDFTIRWYDSWGKSLLDSMGKISVQTDLPEAVATGSTLVLPSHIEAFVNGSTVKTAVTWVMNSKTVSTAEFPLPGVYTLQAKLTEYNNKTLSFRIYSIPDKTLYFVNSSGHKTSDYTLMTSYMQDTLANKEVVDQAYNENDAIPWGYTETKTNSAGSVGGDIFSTLRYLNGGNVVNSPAGTDLTYKFTVKNGSYAVYTGFNDIWNNSTRKADLYINGVKKNAITFLSNSVYGNSVDVTDGSINVTVRNTAAEDPLINWIMIVDNSLTHDPMMGLNATTAAPDTARFSWNKVLGSTSYTLYRADSEDGIYTTVYNGDNVEFTDTGLDPAKKYYYKIGSITSSGESTLSNPLTVLIDQTRPDFKVTLEGTELKAGDSLDDYKSLKLEAWDDLSGAVSARIRINDDEYTVEFTKQSSAEIDLAGRVGDCMIVITVEDRAGNVIEKSLPLIVTTSIDSISQLVNRYEVSGELSGSLLSQLTNNLNQSQHQLDINRPSQAAKHMEDFIKHINNAALAKDIKDEKIKGNLNTDAEALIKLWSTN